MTNLSTQEKNIVSKHPFAQLLSSTVGSSGFAELVYCPLQLVNNKLLGHLATINPFVASTKQRGLIKVIFSGPHGYISPRWHREQVVPTWNYATVSLTCQLIVIESHDEKLKAIKSLSNHFDPQWDFNEFSQMKNVKIVQGMLSAITVFELDIIDVESKFKLSQNRSVDCRKAFKENLRLTGYQELADIQ